MIELAILTRFGCLFSFKKNSGAAEHLHFLRSPWYGIRLSTIMHNCVVIYISEILDILRHERDMETGNYLEERCNLQNTAPLYANLVHSMAGNSPCFVVHNRQRRNSIDNG